jgi:16S rRNA (cytosine1402-N4)-methyltransferase
MPTIHVPVMLKEVLDYLGCKPGKIYVDGTLGGAGHAKAILETILPRGILVGIDQDVDAIKNATQVLAPYSQNIRLFHGNFINLPSFLSQSGITAVDGILLDLGMSLDQLKSSGRGFSFNRDEPLDMRMNSGSGLTAEDIINKMEEKSLREIFNLYGEERWARQIARKIATVRKVKTITSSQQLAQIVRAAVPKKSLSAQRIHPATRVFMALRIVVNREIERLELFLENFADFLKPKGRLCVLSFHSLEDRMVKKRFKALEAECVCPSEFPQCICEKKRIVRSLTPKVIRPTKDEIAANPMARSTRLRACEKL